MGRGQAGPDRGVGSRDPGGGDGTGLGEVSFYSAFSDRVKRLQDSLLRLLTDLRAGGATIAAYGAATKGATLLNTSGVPRGLIEYVVDRNVHKQGRWMPGVRLPILPVEEIERRRPDYLLVLVWNVATEVIRQQAAYDEAGGFFLIPVPAVTLR